MEKSIDQSNCKPGLVSLGNTVELMLNVNFFYFIKIINNVINLGCS